eukprot:872138-Pyramimonas_sp.AAC.1
MERLFSLSSLLHAGCSLGSGTAGLRPSGGSPARASDAWQAPRELKYTSEQLLARLDELKT